MGEGFRRLLLTGLVALVAGFAGAALWSATGLGDARVRRNLVAHPEILTQMAAGLRQQEAAARMAEVGPAITQPFPGAVLGNPRGRRTLVKFTDYGCTYCRSSEADVQRLVAADPDLRVVVREWPIFEGSEEAARMALAAAQQGRYPAFYKAMFSGGPPSPATVTAAATSAGLDLAAARRFAASPAVAQELGRNMELARTLGFTGTPSWVAEGRILEGAVGYDALKSALDGKAPQ